MIGRDTPRVVLPRALGDGEGKRERYTTRLHALGQCYGKNDQFGPDMKWHLYGPDSLH